MNQTHLVLEPLRNAEEEDYQCNKKKEKKKKEYHTFMSVFHTNL